MGKAGQGQGHCWQRECKACGEDCDVFCVIEVSAYITLKLGVVILVAGCMYYPERLDCIIIGSLLLVVTLISMIISILHCAHVLEVWGCDVECDVECAVCVRVSPATATPELPMSHSTDRSEINQRQEISVISGRSATVVNVQPSNAPHRERFENLAKKDLPATWSRMNEDSIVLMVDVAPGTSEYKLVENAFGTTVNNTIIQIQRIQNPTLYRKYKTAQRTMNAFISDKRNFPLMRRLYHGTNVNVIHQINAKGFNRAYSGRNVGAVYGKGTYFAVKASYSAQPQYTPTDTNGYRYMYQCKVLTGEFTAGSKGLLEAPEKDSFNHIPYDSVVDDVQKPTIFVVFPDAHAYPEYLITFQ